MELYKCGPTNFQSAVATAAALLVKTKKQNEKKMICDKREERILIEVPPAGGKTRISIQLVLTLLQKSDDESLDVAVVYPNKTLLLQDKEQWDNVEDMLNINQQDKKQVKLTQYESLAEAKNKIGPDTIVIIDEIDHVLIDQCKQNDI